MENSKLIDKDELIKRHPALGAKPHRLAWLIRTRQIPFISISPRRIAFDEAEIAEWIEKRRLSSAQVHG